MSLNLFNFQMNGKIWEDDTTVGLTHLIHGGEVFLIQTTSNLFLNLGTPNTSHNSNQFNCLFQLRMVVHTSSYPLGILVNIIASSWLPGFRSKIVTLFVQKFKFQIKSNLKLTQGSSNSTYCIVSINQFIKFTNLLLIYY